MYWNSAGQWASNTSAQKSHHLVIAKTDMQEEIYRKSSHSCLCCADASHPSRLFQGSAVGQLLTAWVFFMPLKYPVSSWRILITSVLNSASDRLFITISFRSFLEFCSALSIGPYFFVSSIWQPPCVCFCVLGRAHLIPCLSSVANCRKGPC